MRRRDTTRSPAPFARATLRRARFPLATRPPDLASQPRPPSLFLPLRCSKLVSLDLGGCKHLATDASLVTLAQHCPGLRSLNLRFCEQLSDDAVNAVYRHCLNVQVRR